MWLLAPWTDKLWGLPLRFCPQRNKASMRELSVKQRVICKYRNTRYYHSEVVELTAATFYEVVFDDGSYSNNLFPEDIEVRRVASQHLLCQVWRCWVMTLNEALIISAYKGCWRPRFKLVQSPSSPFALVAEPWLRPARTAGWRWCCSGAMDRWADIRSQVHGVALHPHVPGKPAFKSLPVTLTQTCI